MAKDPAMMFYVGDWLSSPRVACMSLAQQGAYLRLLCYCWASGDASLPDDDDVLATLSGMDEGWLKGGCQMVRVCFEPHPTKTGFITNKRLFAVWSERQQWREKSRQGGRLSAAKRQQQKELTSAKGGSRVVEPPHEPKGNSSSSISSSSSSSIKDSNAVRGKRESKQKFDPLTVEIPDSLDCEQFRTAWATWAQFRAEIKKPLTPTMAKAQLAEFEEWGVARAVAAVEHTVRMGWVGLKEPETARQNGNGPARNGNRGELTHRGLREFVEAHADDQN